MLHDMDERQTERYVEMLGRFSALHLEFGNPKSLPEISTKMRELSQTPLLPGSRDILDDTLASEVLSAFDLYLTTGVDAAMEYLQAVARKT